MVSTKTYDKQDDFNIETVHYPFLGGDAPRSLPMVYTFQKVLFLQEYVLMLVTSTIETIF